ncbi:MAG: hypothetical protein ACRCZJ_09725 [Erysipelotrichaceae bacterium]
MLVKVCERCSGIRVEEIKKKNPDADVREGCLAHCNQHPGKVFGFINYQLVMEDTKADFLSHLEEK